MLKIMNAQAAALAYEVSQLPEQALSRAIKSLAPIFREYTPAIELTEDDERDLALALVEIDNGDLASDAEVAHAVRSVHAAVGLPC